MTELIDFKMGDVGIWRRIQEDVKDLLKSFHCEDTNLKGEARDSCSAAAYTPFLSDEDVTAVSGREERTGKHEGGEKTKLLSMSLNIPWAMLVRPFFEIGKGALSLEKAVLQTDFFVIRRLISSLRESALKPQTPSY